MPLTVAKKRNLEAQGTSHQEDALLRSDALFRAEESKDLRSLIAEHIEELQRYDVLGMERIVAILPWGRSGSLLLASYFDAHDDVIMLPELCGWRLHKFIMRYHSLPLRDKLIAYPAFEPEFTRFFEGQFAISTTRYYAAVQAITEASCKWSPDFLASRRAFFIFVHIAYTLALGRRPANACPLIVYAQHEWDDIAARHLVEDFPQAKFFHTVRDPISSCDALFHFHLDALAERDIFLPHSVLHYLTSGIDRPHSGMESRTRTVRLEDLHSDTAGTMHDLAGQLGLLYQPSLLNSTFNGIPFVAKRDGKTWSGQNLEQVQRKSWHLARRDLALMFALFYENFLSWNYPRPRAFDHRIVRVAVFVSVVLLPTKMEIIAARAILERRIRPSLRRGNILPVLRSLLGIGVCRLKIIGLLVPAFWRRCVHGATLLDVEHGNRPGRRDDRSGAPLNQPMLESLSSAGLQARPSEPPASLTPSGINACIDPQGLE